MEQKRLTATDVSDAPIHESPMKLLQEFFWRLAVDIQRLLIGCHLWSGM